MKKRRIYWPQGNPQFDAWEVPSGAGHLVIRRNHAPVRHGPRRCQGWDLWLKGKYLGAVGSRSFSEISTLDRRSLKTLVLPACCGRHQEFTPGQPLPARPGWGGRRPNAGRPCKGPACRVRFATTVDPRTLAWLDKERGAASRGEYLDRLIQNRRLA